VLEAVRADTSAIPVENGHKSSASGACLELSTTNRSDFTDHVPMET